MATQRASERNSPNSPSRPVDPPVPLAVFVWSHPGGCDSLITAPRRAARVGFYRLVESSSDIILEAEGEDEGAALVGLAQGFTHITTGGQAIEPSLDHPVDLSSSGDAARLAVAFANELIFWFTTEGFLPVDGRLKLEKTPDGHRVTGSLHGFEYDPEVHRAGSEVKAATLHDARLVKKGGKATARVLLDL